MTTSSIQHYREFGEPELPIFNFSLPALLRKVRGDFPGLLPKRVTVWLRIQPTLATVHLDGDEVVIDLHAVVNHAQTPEQVIGFNLLHELLHMIIPKRGGDGHVTCSPRILGCRAAFPRSRSRFELVFCVPRFMPAAEKEAGMHFRDAKMDEVHGCKTAISQSKAPPPDTPRKR